MSEKTRVSGARQRKNFNDIFRHFDTELGCYDGFLVADMT